MKSQLPAAAERAPGNYLTLLSSIIVENRFAPVPAAKHMIDCPPGYSMRNVVAILPKNARHRNLC
jgi:hypothetical protein